MPLNIFLQPEAGPPPARLTAQPGPLIGRADGAEAEPLVSCPLNLLPSPADQHFLPHGDPPWFLFYFTLQTIHKSRASTAQNLLTSHPHPHRGQATRLPTLTYCRASRPALPASNRPHTEPAALCGPPSTSLRPISHLPPWLQRRGLPGRDFRLVHCLQP